MAKKVVRKPGFKWLRKNLLPIRLFLLVLLMLVTTAYTAAWGFQQRYKDDPLKLGVSFSIKYAEQLDNDWKRNYLALVDDIGVKNMRLMSYWDLIEPQRNNYNFDDLDWQIAQAEAHDIQVTLAIGQRQPRWPECHIPGWAIQLSGNDYQQAVLDMLKTVVGRYKDSPVIESWQLENENANRHFGECSEFDNSFLDEEVAAVLAVDDSHDIDINASNQSGVPLREPVGDNTGFSVYKRAHFDALGRTWGWSFWYVPSWWHSLRAATVEGLHGNTQAFIHELQAEPWGPVETQFLTSEEQAKTMDPAKLKEIVEFAKQTGMKEIYLWGGEWWYWRLNNFNDKQIWDTARDIFDY